MNNFLDIIIPEYNCQEKYMDELLKSISNQKNVDFKEIGIIIVNDNSSKKFKNGFFRIYPQLNIKYYKKDINEGVGMTRQYGLDRSDASYVTFVDQDDEIYGDNTLSEIINNLKTNAYELLITSYIEELFKDGKLVNYIHECRTAQEALHGVFIKRQAMIDNDIKFIPGIRYHDDFYMKRSLTTVLKYHFSEIITYKWKYNESSIVRTNREHKYEIETFDDIFKAVEKRIKFYKDRAISSEDNVICTILLPFILLESEEFLDEKLIEKKEKYE